MAKLHVAKARFCSTGSACRAGPAGKGLTRTLRLGSVWLTLVVLVVAQALAGWGTKGEQQVLEARQRRAAPARELSGGWQVPPRAEREQVEKVEAELAEQAVPARLGAEEWVAPLETLVLRELGLVLVLLVGLPVVPGAPVLRELVGRQALEAPQMTTRVRRWAWWFQTSGLSTP